MNAAEISYALDAYTTEELEALDAHSLAFDAQIVAELRRRDVLLRDPRRERPMTPEKEVTLPDGRRLTAGTEVSIAGGGRFVFRYGDTRGNLTFYGPIDNSHAKWRSFRAEKVRTIHRTEKARP